MAGTPGGSGRPAIAAERPASDVVANLRDDVVGRIADGEPPLAITQQDITRSINYFSAMRELADPSTEHMPVDWPVERRRKYHATALLRANTPINR